jgi:hypothetical protein
MDPQAFALSPETARKLAEFLNSRAGRGPAGSRFPVGYESAVVRCGDHESDTPRPHYRGMVRDIAGLESGDHSDAGTEYVWLADLAGGTLTADEDYHAIRCGEHAGADEVTRPVFWCRAAGTGAGVWMARLTGTSAGRWKYYRLTLDGSGVWQDDGAESADYTAVPSTIDGTNYAGAAAGLRVVMWESQQAGFQEFLPVGYAASGVPGLVSTAAQTMGDGAKTFRDAVVVNDDAPNTNATYFQTHHGASGVKRNAFEVKVAGGIPAVTIFSSAEGGEVEGWGTLTWTGGIYGETEIEVEGALALTTDGGTNTYISFDNVTGDAVFANGSWRQAPSTGYCQCQNVIDGAVGFAVDGADGYTGSVVVRDAAGTGTTTFDFEGGILVGVT